MKKNNGCLSDPNFPLVIGIGVLIFLLLIGFSCDMKIEIKQKPSSAETKE